MAHGKIEVAAGGAVTASTTAADEDPTADSTAAIPSTKLEELPHLSFAQRRHELHYRLWRHVRGLQSVAALTSSAASCLTSRGHTPHLGASVACAQQALQHARTAWVNQDEAQDALFFFHALLFPGRAAPHDVYGAGDMLRGKRRKMEKNSNIDDAMKVDGKGAGGGVEPRAAWWDLPRDIQLAVDPYLLSQECHWNKEELEAEWNWAVRRKLVQSLSSKEGGASKLPWNISLQGGVVKLTHGAPKEQSQVVDEKRTSDPQLQVVYPIEANLTVLPNVATKEKHEDNVTANDSMDAWTLLSLYIRVRPKTGELSHQLETSNRQLYDLHRIAVGAMARAAKHEDVNPLLALFHVAHRFTVSWQLEVLSAQALSLKRGAWAAHGLTITPVQFVDEEAEGGSGLLGTLSIAFWTLTDRSPTVSFLDGECEAVDPKLLPPSASNQWILTIHAYETVGLRVALSEIGRAHV